MSQPQECVAFSFIFCMSAEKFRNTQSGSIGKNVGADELEPERQRSARGEPRGPLAPPTINKRGRTIISARVQHRGDVRYAVLSGADRGWDRDRAEPQLSPGNNQLQRPVAFGLCLPGEWAGVGRQRRPQVAGHLHRRRQLARAESVVIPLPHTLIAAQTSPLGLRLSHTTAGERAEPSRAELKRRAACSGYVFLDILHR